jgi:hypothetical protein
LFSSQARDPTLTKPIEKANGLSALEAAAAAAIVADAHVTFDQSTQTGEYLYTQTGGFSDARVGENFTLTASSGAVRDEKGSWTANKSIEQLRVALHDKAQRVIDVEQQVHEALGQLHAQEITLHEQIEVFYMLVYSMCIYCALPFNNLYMLRQQIHGVDQMRELLKNR